MLWTDIFTAVVVITYFSLDYFLRRKLSLFGSAISIVLLILHYGFGLITGSVWTVLEIIAGNVLTLSFLSFFGYYIIWAVIGAGMFCYGIFFGEGDEPAQASRNGMPENIARARGVTASNTYNTNKW